MKIPLILSLLFLSPTLSFAFGLGSLQIKPTGASLCGASDVYVSGESVRLQTSGFAPSSAVEINYQAGINTAAQHVTNATTDANGNLDVTVVVPQVDGLRKLGSFSAKGVGADGTEKMSGGMFVQTSEPTRDADSDGIVDVCDVCPDVADPDQANRDHDALGDVCDPHPDEDNAEDNDKIMRQYSQ